MAINSIANLTDSTVAGSNTEIQYNNSGVFGASSNLTFNGTDELQLTDNTKLTLGTGNDADIYYDGTNLVIEPQVVGSGDVIINDQATVFLNETADTNTATGVTLNIGAPGNKPSANQALTFKSSDIAHGMTSTVEADTFFYTHKYSSTAGGCIVCGVNDGGTAPALHLQGFAGSTTPNNTDTTSSTGVINLSASKYNGSTDITTLAATENALAIAGNSTRVIVKGDGTIHASDTTWADALDDMPDALAGRAYTTEMAEQHGGLLGGMQIHAPELVKRMEDVGIVTRAEKKGEGHIEGHRFLNLQKGIKFSWDMGFQNFTFLAEIAKVLTQEQRDALPQQMRTAFAQLDANKSKELLT